MATVALTLVSLCFVAATTSSSGCASVEVAASTQPVKPINQVYAIKADYTAAMKILNTARQLSQIDDNQARQIEVVRKQASQALDDAEEAALTGASNFGTLLDAAQKAVDQLTAMKTKIKH
jgi:predicted phage gp36 major capsid-like protein